MNVRTLVSVGVALTLTGCATVETAADRFRDEVRAHPVVTGVVIAVAAGSIAAAVEHHHDQRAAADAIVHRPDLDAGICSAHHPC